MKQYFFILGNNPSLSVAEILAWLKRNNIEYTNPITDRDFFVVSLNQDLPTDLLDQLGGVIKFGEIMNEFDSYEDITSDWLVETVSSNHESGKLHFGFSVYPKDKQTSFYLRGVGLEAKKHLREYKISSRLVMSKQENLSSVIVQKNKLVGDSGWEIVLLKLDNYFVGRTIGVQPFESLGKRDYGRPDRDDFSGMIPPKLAQAMINLAVQSEDSHIMDPFCGSGTIVQEALLMGYQKISGFDYSERAIKDSKENILWLSDEFGCDISGVNFQKVDVRELDGNIKNVDAIITEPYLGPPARHGRTIRDIEKIINELTDLYKRAFDNFKNILKPSGMVVIIFPVFVEKNNFNFMPIDKIVDMNFFEKIIIIPTELQNIYSLSKRKTLVYGRSYQKVQREIIVLRRK